MVMHLGGARGRRFGVTEETVELSLGAFGRTGLEMHAGQDISGAARAALLHYVARLGSSGGAIRFPHFRRLLAPETPALSIDLQIDSKTRMALENEAERQGVALQALFEHAVLVYLADLS